MKKGISIWSFPEGTMAENFALTAVVAARRGGLSSTFDELNKFFTISGMPVASGQYWNSIHGGRAGEAMQEAEGNAEYAHLSK